MASVQKTFKHSKFKGLELELVKLSAGEKLMQDSAGTISLSIPLIERYTADEIKEIGQWLSRKANEIIKSYRIDGSRIKPVPRKRKASAKKEPFIAMYPSVFMD